MPPSGNRARVRSSAARARAALGVALAALASLASPALASILLRLDVEELAITSELVAVGRVEAARGEWNAPRTAIRTIVTLRLYDVIARTPGTPSSGAAAGGAVEFSTPGGVADGMGMKAFGAATFRVGEEVVVFLERTGPRLGVAGWTQGKWLLAPRPEGAAPATPLGDRVVHSAAGAASLVVRAPDGALVPAAPLAPRTLRDLASAVRAARGDP